MSKRGEEARQAVYESACTIAKKGRRATVTEVAEATGLPRSSVAYSAQAMGYKGWTDFTSKLVSYYQTEVIDSADGVSTSVSIVARRICEAQGKLILVAALGDAEICMDYLMHRLSECGFWAVPYSEGVLEHDRGGHDIAALVVLNESGMALMPACIEALDADCQVISVTASHDTPISKISTVNVVIKNNKSDTSNYKPNYFTAGALVFLEKLIALLEKDNSYNLYDV